LEQDWALSLCHHAGHFQKQVSCYFQAQTHKSTLSGNICFNGPRAGFNFNDGMGGGDLLKGNLIFNMVRETQDHGRCTSFVCLDIACYSCYP
jgi:hypothetical protein